LGCETICFRKTYKNTENTIIQNGKEIPSEIEDLYPSRIIGRKKIKNLQLLPYLVLKVYEETFSAFTNNLRILTGIGIRTLIEAICIERKATGRNLLEKIHNLVSMGILSKDNSEVLHSIRVFGNEVVHEIDIPSEDLLSITMDIVENLLQSTYILPHLKEKLHKRKDIPF
jgi:hypothetical protein